MKHGRLYYVRNISFLFGSTIILILNRYNFKGLIRFVIITLNLYTFKLFMPLKLITF